MDLLALFQIRSELTLKHFPCYQGSVFFFFLRLLFVLYSQLWRLPPITVLFANKKFFFRMSNFPWTLCLFCSASNWLYWVVLHLSSHKYDVLESGAWSDRFRLSLDCLVDDHVQDDFELFFELKDELEPFWLSGWDADLHFLVTEWRNTSL